MKGLFSHGVKRCRMMLSAVVLVLVFAAAVPAKVQAAIGDRYNISVQGTLHYTEAWSLLAGINGIRRTNSLDTLAMDESLMASAMQRSAELTVFYSSELRPNMADALAINTKAAASYVMRGYTNATDAAKALSGSTAALERIKNGDYKSIGIGCFEVNEKYYWTLLFSKSAGTPKAHVDSKRAVTVTVTELGRLNRPVAMVNNEITSQVTMYASNTETISVYWQDALVTGVSNPNTTAVEASSFKWKSSKKSVASVSSAGVITAKKTGTAVITAVPKVKSGSVEGISVKVTVAENTFTAELAKTLYTHTGREIKPTVTAVKGDTVLTQNTDYTVTYSNNKNVGYGSVTVKGLGDYAGQQQTLSFRIRPSKMKTLKATSSTASTMKLTWKKKPQATGYQIQYATDSGMKENLKTKDTKKLKLTIKKLKSGTTYYVRMRAYKQVSDDERIYSAWSSKKSVTIK